MHAKQSDNHKIKHFILNLEVNIFTHERTFLPVNAALCSAVSPMLLGRLTFAPACRIEVKIHLFFVH